MPRVASVDVTDSTRGQKLYGTALRKAFNSYKNNKKRVMLYC